MEYFVEYSTSVFDGEILLLVIGIVGTLLGTVLGWVLNELGKRGRIKILNKGITRITAEGLEEICVSKEDYIKKSLPNRYESMSKDEIDIYVRTHFQGGENEFGELCIYKESSASFLNEVQILLLSLAIELEIFNSSTEKRFMRNIRLVIRSIFRKVSSTELSCSIKYKDSYNVGMFKSEQFKNVDMDGHERLERSVTAKFTMTDKQLKTRHILRFGKVELWYEDINNKTKRIKICKYDVINDIFKKASKKTILSTNQCVS